MSTSNPLRLPVADLLRRAGSSREFSVSAQAGGAANGVAEVAPDAEVRAEGTLEHVADGIVVRGWVHAPWQAVCRRCLQPITGEVSVHVDELFEPSPLEGETYPLDDDTLDLRPLVRDALALELPIAPLCADDCAGICPLCGVDRNEVQCACRIDEPDPRWAALRSLEC